MDNSSISFYMLIHVILVIYLGKREEGGGRERVRGAEKVLDSNRSMRFFGKENYFLKLK